MNSSKIAFVLIASLLTASAASAVEVARCPATISVNIDGMQPSTDTELRKQLQDRNDEFRLPEVMAINNSVKALDLAEISYLKLNLVRGNKAQCGYAIEGTAAPRGDLTSETRLYTRDGRNILRISHEIDPGVFVWIYFTVTDYSLAGIEAKQVRAARVLGYFDGGGPIYTMGWATGISAQ